MASISLTDRIGLALVNAPDVLAAIAPHASRCLVLHGHRHRDWIGTCQNVVLCSAPSVTMGSQWEKTRGSFHVHEFALGAGGGIRLTATGARERLLKCCHTPTKDTAKKKTRLSGKSIPYLSGGNLCVTTHCAAFQTGSL